MSRFDRNLSRAQASWEGNGELVQAFLDAEPEAVNAVDRSPFGGGYNALMYAAYAGHLELCQLLLRHGAAKKGRTRRFWDNQMWLKHSK